MKISLENPENFYEEFSDHKKEIIQLVKQLTKCQQKNTEMIEQLSENTRDLIEIYKDAKGAIRIGGMIGRFFQWILSIAAISVVLKWLSSIFNS